MTEGTSPFPASMRVADARDAYLRENGFTLAEYDAPRTKAFLFGFTFSVPNTKNHQRGIMLHDLHHVATGFGTDLTGEGEISAFEARGGTQGLDLYVTSLVLLGVVTGMVVAPRRTLRAFRLSWRCRTLFADERAYEEMLSGTVGELRARLGLPRDGIASAARGLHSKAPRAEKSGVSAPTRPARPSAASRGEARAEA
jgi:hypothetical protein